MEYEGEQNKELLIQNLVILIKHLRGQYDKNIVPDEIRQILLKSIGELITPPTSPDIHSDIQVVPDRCSMLKEFIQKKCIFSADRSVSVTQLRITYNSITQQKESAISFSRLMDGIIHECNYPIKKVQRSDGKYYVGLTIN